MLGELHAIHNSVVETMSYTKQRYLMPEINWDNHCVAIRGFRGVGKTTLLLQHYKEQYSSSEKCLYISGDSINVVAYGLYNVVRDHFKYGGKAIIIDEIHKYPNWAQELKNSIDTYKDGKFLISGSSSLNLTKATYDLSRRVVYYDLAGFSFREYLDFVHGITFSTLTFDEILQKHTFHASEISRSIPILKYFNEYLLHGYYPFILEGKKEYSQKVLSTIEKVLFEDIAVIFNLTQAKLPVLKKILWLISTAHPFIPNITGMSRDLGISKEYVYAYLEFLEMSGILSMVRNEAKGARLVRKSGKIYFDNSNLPAAITRSIQNETEIGSMRETFFLNQLKNIHRVALHSKTDFMVDGHFAFEIGGASKKVKQISDIELRCHLIC